jgi:hypothetical protein
MHHLAHRPLSLAAGALALLVALACSSSGGDEGKSAYPGDAIASIRDRCIAEVAGLRECDGACIQAQLNLDCPASSALDTDPEFGPYTRCLAACPAVRTCPAGRRFPDCVCVVGCAFKQSKKLQALLAFDADCEREKAEPICK